MAIRGDASGPGSSTLAVLLDGLDEDQRACVVHPGGPLVIEAGPGSGKTRVLTRRIAYRDARGDAPARHTVALTFTRRAAGELYRRLAALGVEGARTGTVHAFSRALLERRWADLGVPPRPMVAQTHRLLREATAACAVPVPANVLAGEVEWAAARGVVPADYQAAAARAGRDPGFDLEMVGAACAAYAQLKRRRGVMDVSDLLVEVVAALEDPEFAAATRWRFRHVLVDEAQDLNRAQWVVVRSVLGAGDDLCMVGDAGQAIYAWNGADARYLTELERAFPHAARLRIVRNYRSVPAVVRAAERVSGTVTPTEPVREDQERSVTVSRYDTSEAEARAVAWRIRQGLAEGVGYGQMAVLGRTHEVLGPVTRALRASGMPVRTGRNLLDEPDVAEALRRLGGAQPTLTSAGCVSELRAIVEDMMAAAPGSRGVDEGSGERLSRLVELLVEWSQDVPHGTLRYLGDWLASTVRSDGGEPVGDGPAIDVATFHRAKGLEWRRVFVIGVESGLVPLAQRLDEEARTAEELRLFSVALTRAEDAVHCSWAARRQVSGRERARTPSPLLELVASSGVGVGVGDGVDPGDPGDAHGAAGPPVRPDEEAMARLRAIRADLLARHRPA